MSHDEEFDIHASLGAESSAEPPLRRLLGSRFPRGSAKHAAIRDTTEMWTNCMKLSICIPTHDGRRETLRQVLDCIEREIAAAETELVQVCVSDNASQDGTSEMITERQVRSTYSLKYCRFDRDMRGVRNFVNVVAMADGVYCWLMGSDDIIPAGGVARMLALLDDFPGVPGVTCNKLNFDVTLSRYLGPDHDLVLPSAPGLSRLIRGSSVVARELGLSFSYMSAHVFRRELWLSVVEQVGIEQLDATRHFPHSYIFLRIAACQGLWYWMSEYCVIQRMGNFCILEENRQDHARFADEFTGDLERVWQMTIEDPNVLRDLRGRLCLLYWNPVAVFIYLSDQRMNWSRQNDLRRRLMSRFRDQWFFWTLVFPALCVPAGLYQGMRTLLDLLDRWVPLRKAWRFTHRLLASLLTLLRRGDRDAQRARSAATHFLTADHRALGPSREGPVPR